MKAQDLMTAHDLWACVETSDAQEVACMMTEHNVGAIPVLDKQGRLEGIITDRDICCRLVAEGRSYDTPARELMSRSVQTVHPDTELSEIESIMREHRIRRLPVVDENQKLQGFISTSDLIHACHGKEEEHELVEVLETITSYQQPA